jgi:hypothetical protein
MAGNLGLQEKWQGSANGRLTRFARNTMLHMMNISEVQTSESNNPIIKRELNKVQ